MDHSKCTEGYVCPFFKEWIPKMQQSVYPISHLRTLSDISGVLFHRDLLHGALQSEEVLHIEQGTQLEARPI